MTRNAAGNLAGFLLSLCITFFMAPFIIRRLGDSRYGAWALVAEVVGYYGLLDLGLRGAVGFYVANYSARELRDRLHAAICSGFWALAAVGTLLALAGIGLALALPRLFVKGGVDATEVVTAMAIMSITIGMSLPLETFSSVLTGARRMDLNNVIEVSSRVLVAAGTYIALKAGGGLVALSVLLSCGRVFTWIASFLLARKIIGPFSLRWSGVRRSELRALAGFGSNALTVAIADILTSRVDLVVVGLFLGARWVAYYNLGRMLVEHASSVNFNITRAFTPHLTYLHSKGDYAERKRLFLLGTRGSCLISIPLAVCMFTFGRPFLGLWVGQAYISGPFFFRSDTVMMVLLLAHLTRWPQSISWQLIISTGKWGFITRLSVISGLVNLGLSLVLVQYCGLAGIALGTLIPMSLVNLVAIPLYVSRRFEFSLLDYARAALLRPIAVGALVLAFAQVLVRMLYPWSWKLLLVEGSLTVLFIIGLCLAIGVTREEREMIRSRAGTVLAGVKRQIGGAAAVD